MERPSARRGDLLLYGGWRGCPLDLAGVLEHDVGNLADRGLYDT